MNAFAESLLSVMLGWVENAANSVYAFFSSGMQEGFLSWLGAHWLLLTAILCGVGVIIDMTVWTVRWQPWRVWKERREEKKRRREKKRFERGYSEADGIAELEVSSAPGRREENEPAEAGDYYVLPANEQPRRAGKKQALFGKLRGILNEEEEGDIGEVMRPDQDERSAYYEPVYPGKDRNE